MRPHSSSMREGGSSGGPRRPRAPGLSALATFVLVASLAVVAAPPSGTRGGRADAAVVSSPRGPEDPLDPLTTAEIDTTFRVIEASKDFPDGAFFPRVELKEPPKSELLAWSPGAPFPRESFANVYDRANNRLYEAVVDLRAHALESWTERPGAQPAVYNSEYAMVDEVVRADRRWQAAIEARGIDPDDVYLDDGWAVGDLTIPGVPDGTRLLRALSFYQGDLPNPYDRPIEGVVVTVDMNRLKVVQVMDAGVRPVNTTITGRAHPRGGLKPLVVTQPDGPSFRVRGNAVSWLGWRFRIGFTQREGLVLDQIGFEHDGVVRPIIHRIAMDEIYVPYAIPARAWAWRAALDIGEYNLGQWAMPLVRGVDVPDNAVFFDEVSANDVGSHGKPEAWKLPHMVAIYERDAGSLWERTDPNTLDRDARLGRQLVVTAGYANGNYTYLTEYVFRMDGGIDVHAGSTGTTLNEGVDSVERGDRWGASVAENIAAPTHQHFFNFRIDFDVDGTDDRVVEDNERAVRSRAGNAFVTTETTIGHEGFRDTNAATDRRWVVQSTTHRNGMDEPTGYELQPMQATQPYSDPDFGPLRRAAYAEHALWVTRYQDGELAATGEYPNQSPPGEGLPAYIADDESVDGHDLVVWYTASFTHLPMMEHYPVMSTGWIGFALRPMGFFDENPALDAPCEGHVKTCPDMGKEQG